MANEEHLALLRQGAAVWNEWREHNPDNKPDLWNANLSGADLSGANLSGLNLNDLNLSGANLSGANLDNASCVAADLSGANLIGADLNAADLIRTNLTRADLSSETIAGGSNLSAATLLSADLTEANLSRAYFGHANLTGANLCRADLTEANFTMADLTHANLSEANLCGAYLFRTDLSEANLSGAKLSGATLQETIITNVDLTDASGLSECKHDGPSTIDFHTLFRSKVLPISFLRGCGLPEKLIEYLPSLRDEAIQFYSCFISYSARDQMFADRLHADLQSKGVRCWFAPHDLPIGAKTWDAIDEAIRLREKLLLILSKASIDSDWVENEVSAAYAEERSRKQVVLVPIRIDNTVMSTTEPWARMLREQRNIGDFRRWKTPTEYQKCLDRLLRDLKTSATEQITREPAIGRSSHSASSTKRVGAVHRVLK